MSAGGKVNTSRKNVDGMRDVNRMYFINVAAAGPAVVVAAVGPVVAADVAVEPCVGTPLQ